MLYNGGSKSLTKGNMDLLVAASNVEPGQCAFLCRGDRPRGQAQGLAIELNRLVQGASGDGEVDMGDAADHLERCVLWCYFLPL